MQDELNSTLQRRQKGERIRPHFVLPKNSTINAIYNQLQYLDSQNANNTDANADAAYPLQQQYLAKLNPTDDNNGYQEQPAAPATTFYNTSNNINGNNGNGASNAAATPFVQYAATLPRASPARTEEPASKTPGLMISHGRPNYVRPVAPVIRPSAVEATGNDRPESNDFTRTLRRIRSGDGTLDGTPAVAGAVLSNNSSERTSENGSSRNSPVTVGGVGVGGRVGINGSGASSPFIVRKNVPIVLQQQQSPQHNSPTPTPSLDTRNDDDISNAIRRLRSVESPDRQLRDGSPANLVLFNNVARPTPPQTQPQQQPALPQQQPQVQWTFVPNANGSNGTAGFQHTIEFTPTVLGSAAPQPKPQQQPQANWTFVSNNNNDAGFHQSVEYPTSHAQPQRPAPPASPIETTLDSLKKTLASVSRSPVSGRKINPNQPAQQQPDNAAAAVAPMSPLVGANGQRDIQRKMQTLRKVDLKQDSSWMNKHNTQSPPTSPPGAASTFQFVPSFKAAPATLAAAASEPQHSFVQPSPVQRQPHVIHHVIQQTGGVGNGNGGHVPAVPSSVDVRNIVSFARDLADSPNRYPEKVVVVTKTRTEPDGRIVKETTTTTHGGGGLNNNGAGGVAGLNDDMFFQNLKFVIDENGDIRPNAFAQQQFQQL